MWQHQLCQTGTDKCIIHRSVLLLHHSLLFKNAYPTVKAIVYCLHNMVFSRMVYWVLDHSNLLVRLLDFNQPCCTQEHLPKDEQEVKGFFYTHGNSKFRNESIISETGCSFVSSLCREGYLANIYTKYQSLSLMIKNPRATNGSKRPP